MEVLQIPRKEVDAGYIFFEQMYVKVEMSDLDLDTLALVGEFSLKGKRRTEICDYGPS